MSKKTVYMIAAADARAFRNRRALRCTSAHSAWWPLPFGYDIFFGFFGCWLLIILAKIIMTPLLQRDETYYDDPKGGEDDE